MAIPLAGALWSWAVDGPIPAEKIHSALAGVLRRPVVPLGTADPDNLPSDAVLCDVWHTEGDFPTSVDCYAPPAEAVESAVATGVARRIGHSLLLPDDTLDPTRFLLAAPDGTLRPVHVDVADSDEGQVLSRLRPCTSAAGSADGADGCEHSGWGPGSIAPGRTAA